MSKGCYHLGEMTAAMIRLYCPDCHRFAQLKRSKLLEQFGPEKPMPTMLRDVKRCDIGTFRWTVRINNLGMKVSRSNPSS